MPGSSLAPRPPKHLGLRATLGAILGGSIAYAFGCDGPTCIASAGLAAVSFRIALIDLKLRVIRDRDVVMLLTIGSVWIICFSQDSKTDLALALLRGLSYLVLFQTIRLLSITLGGREGIGFGDVKLAAVAGPLLYVEEFSLAVAVAAIGGLLFICVFNKIKHRPLSRHIYIPLGSSLSFAIYGFWLYSVCQ